MTLTETVPQIAMQILVFKEGYFLLVVYVFLLLTGQE